MITINGIKYLTPAEYAKHINKGVTTVYNRIKNKQVETKKVLDKTYIKL